LKATCFGILPSSGQRIKTYYKINIKLTSVDYFICCTIPLCWVSFLVYLIMYDVNSRHSQQNICKKQNLRSDKNHHHTVLKCTYLSLSAQRRSEHTALCYSNYVVTRIQQTNTASFRLWIRLRPAAEHFGVIYCWFPNETKMANKSRNVTACNRANKNWKLKFAAVSYGLTERGLAILGVLYKICEAPLANSTPDLHNVFNLFLIGGWVSQ
jgi:hypothetical protein